MWIIIKALVVGGLAHLRCKHHLWPHPREPSRATSASPCSRWPPAWSLTSDSGRQTSPTSITECSSTESQSIRQLMREYNIFIPDLSCKRFQPNCLCLKSQPICQPMCEYIYFIPGLICQSFQPNCLCLKSVSKVGFWGENLSSYWGETFWK